MDEKIIREIYLKKIKQNIEEKQKEVEEQKRRGEKRKEKLREKKEEDLERKVELEKGIEWYDYMSDKDKFFPFPDLPPPEGFTIWFGSSNSLNFQDTPIVHGDTRYLLLKNFASKKGVKKYIPDIKKKFGKILKPPEEYYSDEQLLFRESSKHAEDFIPPEGELNLPKKSKSPPREKTYNTSILFEPSEISKESRKILNIKQVNPKLDRDWTDFMNEKGDSVIPDNIPQEYKLEYIGERHIIELHKNNYVPPIVLSRVIDQPTFNILKRKNLLPKNVNFSEKSMEIIIPEPEPQQLYLIKVNSSKIEKNPSPKRLEGKLLLSYEKLWENFIKGKTDILPSTPIFPPFHLEMDFKTSTLYLYEGKKLLGKREINQKDIIKLTYILPSEKNLFLWWENYMKKGTNIIPRYRKGYTFEYENKNIMISGLHGGKKRKLLRELTREEFETFKNYGYIPEHYNYNYPKPDPIMEIGKRVPRRVKKVYVPEYEQILEEKEEVYVPLQQYELKSAKEHRAIGEEAKTEIYILSQDKIVRQWRNFINSKGNSPVPREYPNRNDYYVTFNIVNPEERNEIEFIKVSLYDISNQRISLEDNIPYIKLLENIDIVPDILWLNLWIEFMNSRSNIIFPKLPKSYKLNLFEDQLKFHDLNDRLITINRKISTLAQNQIDKLNKIYNLEIPSKKEEEKPYLTLESSEPIIESSSEILLPETSFLNISQESEESPESISFDFPSEESNLIIEAPFEEPEKERESEISVDSPSISLLDEPINQEEQSQNILLLPSPFSQEESSGESEVQLIQHQPSTSDESTLEFQHSTTEDELIPKLHLTESQSSETEESFILVPEEEYKSDEESFQELYSEGQSEILNKWYSFINSGGETPFPKRLPSKSNYYIEFTIVNQLFGNEIESIYVSLYNFSDGKIGDKIIGNYIPYTKLLGNLDIIPDSLWLNLWVEFMNSRSNIIFPKLPKSHELEWYEDSLMFYPKSGTESLFRKLSTLTQEQIDKLNENYNIRVKTPEQKPSKGFLESIISIFSPPEEKIDVTKFFKPISTPSVEEVSIEKPRRKISNSDYGVQCRKSKTYYTHGGKVESKKKIDERKKSDTNYKPHNIIYKCSNGRILYYDKLTGKRIDEFDVPFSALIHLPSVAKTHKKRKIIDGYYKLQAKNRVIMYFHEENGKRTRVSKRDVPQDILDKLNA
jgi:hypothetical protein